MDEIVNPVTVSKILKTLSLKINCYIIQFDSLLLQYVQNNELIINLSFNCV